MAFTVNNILFAWEWFSGKQANNLSGFNPASRLLFIMTAVYKVFESGGLNILVNPANSLSS